MKYSLRINPRLHRQFYGAVLLSTVVMFWAKVFGWIDLSWSLIFAPLWVPVTLGMFLCAAALMIMGDNKND